MSKLEHHEDMIDSMKLVDLNKYSQGRLKTYDSERMAKLKKEGIDPKIKSVNPFIKWLISIGRDHKIVLWKLFNGKLMHTDHAISLYHRTAE